MGAAIASAVLYVAGTVLYGVLTGLVIRRRGRTWSEVILLLLGLSAGIWYFGNALDSVARLLFTGPLPAVTQATDIIVCLGIALVPSLLMLMALFYFHERRRRLPRYLLALLTVLICALALPFSLVLFHIIGGGVRLATFTASAVGQVFLGWLALALTSSAWVCFLQTRQATERRESRFFRTLFWGTVLVAAGIVSAPFLIAAGSGRPGPSPEMSLVISLAGLFPGVVFAYFVYRYNYMEFVLRRTLFHAFLALLVISIYYFLIRELSRWLGAEIPGLRVAVVEGLLVIALVYLFPRMGDMLRAGLRFVVFRPIADAEQQLSVLNRLVGADPMLEPERVLSEACKAVKTACKARSAFIALSMGPVPDVYGDVPPGGVSDRLLRTVLDGCASLGSAWVERDDVRNAELLGALRRLNAHFVYPVVYEGRPCGFIAVGRPSVILPMTEEESEQLVVLAGRISAALGRARAIRERLQLQRRLYAREKFASLGQLAASVAHEVRNPLSSIKTLVQCMEEELAARGIRPEETELIVEEINRLSRTVDALLRYARPADAVRPTADFADVLGTVLQILRHEFGRRGCHAVAAVQEDLPPVGTGEDELKEVLFNLILNALEAMPSGGELRITARARDGRLLAAVEDTGPGIPEEMRERVFEPSFTTKDGGTGLGLSIVSERLAEAGGSIRCLGGETGTRMEFDLPLSPGPGPHGEDAGDAGPS
jgi:signal transduction histidine kinase